MARVGVLRVLCLLGFLLLFAPFYDHCNGGFMKQAEAPVAEAPIAEFVPDSLLVHESKIDTITKESTQLKDTIQSEVESEPSFVEKALVCIDDPNSQSIFEIIEVETGAVYNIFTDGISKDDFLKNADEIMYGLTFHLKNICLTIAAIFSLIMLVFSFKNKFLKIQKLSKINLILLTIVLVCIVFFDKLFEDINQIKWGFYAFTTIQITIFIITRKISKQTLD